MGTYSAVTRTTLKQEQKACASQSLVLFTTGNGNLQCCDMHTVEAGTESMCQSDRQHVLVRQEACETFSHSSFAVTWAALGLHA